MAERLRKASGDVDSPRGEDVTARFQGLLNEIRAVQAQQQPPIPDWAPQTVPEAAPDIETPVQASAPKPSESGAKKKKHTARPDQTLNRDAPNQAATSSSPSYINYPQAPDAPPQYVNYPQGQPDFLGFAERVSNNAVSAILAASTTQQATIAQQLVVAAAQGLPRPEQSFLIGGYAPRLAGDQPSGQEQEELTRLEADETERPPMSPGRKKLIKKWGAGLVASVVVSVGLSGLVENACKTSDHGWVKGSCLAVGGFNNGSLKNVPGVREIIGVFDGIYGNSQNATSDEKRSTNNDTNTGSTDTGRPETVPGEVAQDKIDELTNMFSKGIPLGSIDTTLADGNAEILYDKNKSVKLPITSKRTISFMALQKSKTSPLTVTRAKDGSAYEVTYNRDNVRHVVTNLESASLYTVSGDARNGFVVGSSSFTIKFLAKAPLGNKDTAADMVNSFAMPSSEKQAEMIAKLYSMKNLAGVVGAITANKCTNPSDGAPVQTTAAIGTKTDKIVEDTVRRWAMDNKVKVAYQLPGGDNAFDAKTILSQSANYADMSGNRAVKQAGQDLTSALDDRAKSFVVTGKWSCDKVLGS